MDTVLLVVGYSTIIVGAIFMVKSVMKGMENDSEFHEKRNKKKK